MTDTTLTQLALVQPGTKILFNAQEYVVVEHARTRTKISRTSDGKMFVLSMNARVAEVGRDNDALAAALAAREERMAARNGAAYTARPTLTVGTKVRFADTAQTRKAGIAGEESVIVRVNTKTYGLANGYRVTPGLVEEIK